MVRYTIFFYSILSCSHLEYVGGSQNASIQVTNDLFWSHKIEPDETVTVNVRGTRYIPYSEKEQILEYQNKAAEFAKEVSVQLCPNGFSTNHSIPIDYQ